ncbi:MAG: hypothetical protein R2813_02740 [Flavobacteriales bacterium]
MSFPINIKSILPHIIAVVSIIIAAFLYCAPVLKGKEIVQNDIINHKAQSHELKTLKDEGIKTLWTSRVFGGMTVFNIGAEFDYDIMNGIRVSLLRPFPAGVNIIILSCLGFYILLIMFGVNPYVALISAIAYGLSSNLLSSIAAGHNTKIISIAFMAPAIGATILAYRGKLFMGALLTALFSGLLVSASHYQIVYYFILISVVGGITHLVYAIKQHELNRFIKTAGILIVAGIIGFLPSFSKVYNIYEHNKETIRGSKKFLAEESSTKPGGLDKSYAMSWSHGILESFSVVIPTFMGGASAEELPDNGEVSKLVGGPKKGRPLVAPTYIGDQPFLQGVIYFGAAFIFLFFLSLFVVDQRIKIWMLSIIALSFFMAWGRHFSVFTDLLFDYLPMYNKFRTPSMALCIAGIAIPFMGILGLNEIISGKVDELAFKKAFKNTLYITGGLITMLLLYGLVNDWIGPKDAALQAKAPWNNPSLFEALLADRKALYLRDWGVGATIMVIMASLIWFQRKGRLSLTVMLPVLILIFVGDMWRVSKRYMNDDTFVTPKEFKGQFEPNPADKVVLQDPDPHHRVINLTRNPWTDAMTSYHHENVGGHHPAKIQRYQDMIENHLSTQVQMINQAIVQTPDGRLSMNPQISKQMTAYNMLNAKYLIVKNEAGGVVSNPTACGNAWFVSEIKKVSTDREEMDAVGQIDPMQTAIVHQQFADDLYSYEFGKDASANVRLTSFDRPDVLKYESNNAQAGLAVFSEVIYTNGWKAFIDDNPAEIYRVNYLLRAMKVPAGKHVIEMRFEPDSYALGERVSLAGTSMFLLLVGGFIFMIYRNQKSLASSENA